MKSKVKLTELVYDIYRELYANSEPKADFDELVEKAEINEDGQKVIDYMAYEIDDDVMKEIINKHCKENRLNKEEKNAVNISVYLGCSPRSKIKNYED